MTYVTLQGYEIISELYIFWLNIYHFRSIIRIEKRIRRKIRFIREKIIIDWFRRIFKCVYDFDHKEVMIVTDIRNYILLYNFNFRQMKYLAHVFTNNSFPFQQMICEQIRRSLR